jgi:hypothetical protein
MMHDWWREMAKVPMLAREIRARLLRAREPVSATELAGMLRVNRTTIVRALPGLGEELRTMGATRSTRYALRRNVRHIGNQWAIYRIDERGQATQWAELEAVHDRAWRMCWSDEAPEWAGLFQGDHGIWSGFPFFLTDVRPQGYLGRRISARFSRLLGLPNDLRYWSDDDVLVFLQAAGGDLPGNLVVGEAMVRDSLAGVAPGHVIADEDRELSFPWAAEEMAILATGSSAGGEQPKFLSHVQRSDGGYQAVLVKFSAPMTQDAGRRWADLLACEFHAHEVLAESGLASGGARLTDTGGRRFLEIPRFDRHGVRGRCGVVSLESVTAALEGLPRDWHEGAEMLMRHGLVDAGACSTIRLLHAFGELIGNNDMHAGNLAFYLNDSLPLRLTPSYDMLPMLWAPGSQGELVRRRFAPAAPFPWVEDFWQRVMDDSRISAEFRQIAADALETLRRMNG